MTKPIRVGLFIPQESEYSQEICRGAYEACQELGLELVTFFGGKIDNYNDEYENYINDQKTSIYSYANCLGLDFLLISPTTICRTSVKLREQFVRFFNIPVIVLNYEMDGYSFVSYNNDKGVKEAIEYMIEQCHCQHIGMLTAYKDSQGSIQRVNAYKKTLDKNHIKYNEDDILYVSSYVHANKETVEQWLEDHPDFDGIMCSTDDLAFDLYDILKEKGKKIGKDIMVAGFDDLPQAIHVVPQLSSCHVDASLLGYLGVSKGYNQWKTNELFKQELDTHFIPRMSVNCDVNRTEELIQFVQFCKNNQIDSQYIAEGISNYIFDDRLVYSMPVKDLVTQLFYELLEIKYYLKDGFKENVENLIFEIFNNQYIQHLDLERFFDCFSLVLDLDLFDTNQEKERVKKITQHIYSKVLNCYQAVSSKKEKDNNRNRQYINEINKDTMIVDNYSNIYELLAQNLKLLNIQNAQLYVYPKTKIFYKYHDFEIPNELILKINIVDGEIIETYNKMISVNQVLSLQSLKHRVITSIYSNEYQYGILICDLPINGLSIIDYISTQFGTAFHMMSIVKTLNRSSMTDELTKVYNRRGLYHEVEGFVKECQEEENIYLFLADLDKLKLINDTYGHEYGDKAIVLATDILKNVFSHNGIIGRIGGDEFIVIFKSQGSSFIKGIDDMIKDMTEQMNKRYQYPFNVSISYGVSVFDKDIKNTDFKKIIEIADTLMYEEKKIKKDS